MQARQEVERRLQEKEEEFENTRKNFARAMDSMQASLEGESKAKQEALRQVTEPNMYTCGFGQCMQSVGSHLTVPSRLVSCRIKKKIEADINELEMALDHANKANAEAAKQIKRHAATLLDVDTACEEENRARLDIEDQVGMADRKGTTTNL